MSNHNSAYNPKVIDGGWKRAEIFSRNQLLAINSLWRQINLPILDEVPPTNAEKARNALSTDRTRSALDSMHLITPVFDNWRSERMYMMNRLQVCLRALEKAHDEIRKLSGELALTQQMLNSVTNQLDEIKRK